jgi:nitroimidazol reductase NimA-like FMN-containing flavoprotein (pyridoxamine 5'-phosphate oxidase superfamily)
MTETEIAAFLRVGKNMVIGTHGINDRIHLVPVWYVLDGGDLAFWSYAKSQKTINIKRNPQTSGLVDSGDTYATLRGVLVVGRGEVVTDPAEVLRIGRELVIKYESFGVVSDLDRAARKRVVIRLRPDTVISWDHSRLGLPSS